MSNHPSSFRGTQAYVVVLYTPGTGCAQNQAVYSTHEAAQAHIDGCELYPPSAYNIEAYTVDVPPVREGA